MSQGLAGFCYFFVVRTRRPRERGTSDSGTRTWGVAASLVTLGLVLSPGCGSERPRAEGTGAYNAPPVTGDIFKSVDGGTAPPGCGTKPDGTQCDCIDVPLFVDPPTMYFVLDRSGSMKNPNKWDQVRVVVGKIMRGLGPRANFGAMMFPASTNNCAPGVEIMSVRPGDPPTSGADGPTTSTLLAVTRVTPAGGTPTGATLAIARQNLSSVSGKAFVILATDGAPNCNAQAACGYDQCQPNIENVQGCPKQGPFNCCEPPDGYRENCNDVDHTLTEVTRLKQANIPVYVVGLPGAAPYAALLDQMAVTGGTAQTTPGGPKYFAVNTATEDVILAALKKIAAQIAGNCVFDLKEPPTDPSFVNVYMDDAVLPFEPVNGWTIDGRTVTLVGDACSRVKSGDVLSVRIIAGCPRVEPK